MMSGFPTVFLCGRTIWNESMTGKENDKKQKEIKLYKNKCK